MRILKDGKDIEQTIEELRIQLECAEAQLSLVAREMRKCFEGTSSFNPWKDIIEATEFQAARARKVLG